MKNFKFKKYYGQNFLNNENVINDISNLIDANEDDLIIEIGPGAGALTKYLIKKKAYLICYEIDKNLEEYLALYNNNKTKIIFDDFLKRDIKKDFENIKYNNLYIVGNLPYYITTPIIEHIIDMNLNISNMVFMVQNEVADRLSADICSKDYGYITALLNYYFDIQKKFIVKASNFTPMPKVDSAIVKFYNKDRLLTDVIKLNILLKDAFKFKRKNLRNNLKNYDLTKIESILNKYNLSLNNRAEDISIEIFVDIVNNI